MTHDAGEPSLYLNHCMTPKVPAVSYFPTVPLFSPANHGGELKPCPITRANEPALFRSLLTTALDPILNNFLSSSAHCSPTYNFFELTSQQPSSDLRSLLRGSKKPWKDPKLDHVEHPAIPRLLCGNIDVRVKIFWNVHFNSYFTNLIIIDSG